MKKALHSIPKTCIFLAFVLLLPCALSQTAGDRVDLVVSALQDHDFAKALELLRPALQRAPGSAQLWAMQGTAYAGEGRKQDALASLRTARKISPGYRPARRGATQSDNDVRSKEAIP